MTAVRRFDVIDGKFANAEDGYCVQITRADKPLDDDESKRFSITIEEKVMEWTDANHIYKWFMDNVFKGDKNSGPLFMSSGQIERLLEICEKVLNASQLVWEPAYVQSDYNAINRRMEAKGVPPKVIKNISVAHKLLPFKFEKHSSRIEGYDEAYIKDIEATRNWAERMLMDIKRGMRGTIYLHLSWTY